MTNQMELKPLFDAVEDLIKRVADIESAEIKKLRAKVRVALLGAETSLHEGASQMRRQAIEAARRTDRYVRSNPWRSLGTATAVAFACGLLLAGRDAG